jgi:hypothetical protein
VTLAQPLQLLDAERALLGALLHLDVDQAAELLDGLEPHALGDTRHRSVLTAIRGAVAARECPDPVVVRARLLTRDDGVRFVEGDPAQLLTELHAGVPVVANAGTYRRMVLEAAALREREERHARLGQALAAGDVELFDELLAGARPAQLDAARRAPIVPLVDFLAVDDDPVCYRVDQLWPVGGRALLAAQYKAGKTTLLDNLLRALVDGQPFLGRFDVAPPAGPVVVVDNELDERMLRRWLREQRIEHPERVAVLSLRGRVGTFDLLDPVVRAAWARQLRDLGAAVVLFDCLRPVLDALGLSEDKEAGRFLVAFDALLHEAGVGEAVVVHHMGHAGERSRGDSRLRDWPDVEWRLMREADELGEQAADARRYFAASGRDVLVPEGLLEYDPEARRLTLSGGNRRETAADDGLPELLDYLELNDGASKRAIEAALKDTLGGRNRVRHVVDRAVHLGVVEVLDGPNRSRLHCLANPGVPGVPPGAPAHPAHPVRRCASAPIGGARHTAAADGDELPLDEVAHRHTDEPGDAA